MIVDCFNFEALLVQKREAEMVVFHGSLRQLVASQRFRVLVGFGKRVSLLDTVTTHVQLLFYNCSV